LTTASFALLSATSHKSKVKNATGGLLRKLGNNGVLVIKDVTSILSADQHTRGPVLAAFAKSTTAVTGAKSAPTAARR
jgi:hypothetical protein